MNNKAYLVIEINEIRRHAYFLRMRQQRPISDDEAAVDWSLTQLPVEYCSQYARRESEIGTMCAQYCERGTCRGPRACPLSPVEIRAALGGEYHNESS